MILLPCLIPVPYEESFFLRMLKTNVAPADIADAALF